MAIFSLSFCCVEVVYAKEDYSITTCKYSEAYLEWEKLSDEEKKSIKSTKALCAMYV